MNYLLRFEDTYGMYDLYRALHNIGESNIIIKNDISYNRHKNLVMESGLGSNGCFKLKADGRQLLVDENIGTIVIIVDLDADNNNGSCTLDPKSALNKCSKFTSLVNSVNQNIKIRYVPTVFAAETVMLYQYLTRDADKFVIEDIVHPVNTWKFHIIMVAMLAGFDKIMDAKKIRNYCAPSIIRKAFIESYKLNLTRNKPVIDFMLNRSPGLTEIEFLNFLTDEYNNFSIRKANKIDFRLLGVEVDSHTSLYQRKKDFPFFPKAYR